MPYTNVTQVPVEIHLKFSAGSVWKTRYSSAIVVFSILFVHDFSVSIFLMTLALFFDAKRENVPVVLQYMLLTPAVGFVGGFIGLFLEYVFEISDIVCSNSPICAIICGEARIYAKSAFGALFDTLRVCQLLVVSAAGVLIANAIVYRWHLGTLIFFKSDLGAKIRSEGIPILLAVTGGVFFIVYIWPRVSLKLPNEYLWITKDATIDMYYLLKWPVTVSLAVSTVSFVAVVLVTTFSRRKSGDENGNS